MGYVMNQETILLTRLLSAGLRPDIVIFLIGANEAYVGGYSPGLPSAHGDLLAIKARFEQTIYLDRLLDKSYAVRLARGLVARLRPPRVMVATDTGDPVPVSTTDGDVEVKARQTIDNFQANIALVRGLGQAYGFESYFFWQPILMFGERKKTAFERVVAEHPALNDEAADEAIRAVYREADRRASAGSYVFLGRVFDGVDQLVYVDGVHLGPYGNELIAGAILAEIKQRH
jgi:lysophospholipase L1-like esterase